MRRRQGWTLLELLTVLVVVGVLCSLAILKYIDLTRTAVTSNIMGDFLAVRLAAYNYEADHRDQWPADAATGVTPPELANYLPDGFSFQKQVYQLDWENNGAHATPYQLAISVITADPKLVDALVATLGTRAPFYLAGNKLTYVLIDDSGNY